MDSEPGVMMDEGAPQAAGSSTHDDVAAEVRAKALTELRYGWGEAYRIGWTLTRGWWARRRDGIGEEITAAGSEGMWEAIRADYTRQPVPRDAGAGEQAAPA